MKAQILADVINRDCVNRAYFWAIGTIKETLKLWREPSNYKLLCATAKLFVNHYVDEIG